MGLPTRRPRLGRPHLGAVPRQSLLDRLKFAIQLRHRLLNLGLRPDNRIEARGKRS